MAMMVNPKIGDQIIKDIKEETGQDVHIILCIYPADKEEGGKITLGAPSFITSLDNEDSNQLIAVTAEYVKKFPFNHMLEQSNEQ